jgi:hypothetical protein
MDFCSTNSLKKYIRLPVDKHYSNSYKKDVSVCKAVISAVKTADVSKSIRLDSVEYKVIDSTTCISI